MIRPGFTLINLAPDVKGDRWMPNLWRAVARGEISYGRSVFFVGPYFEVVAAHQDLQIPLFMEKPSIKQASLVLSCDNEIAEAAIAFGRPSVTLFGSTSPCARKYDGAWETGLHNFIWQPSGLDRITVIDIDKEIANLRRAQRLDFRLKGEMGFDR